MFVSVSTSDENARPRSVSDSTAAQKSTVTNSPPTNAKSYDEHEFERAKLRLVCTLREALNFFKTYR